MTLSLLLSEPSKQRNCTSKMGKINLFCQLLERADTFLPPRLINTYPTYGYAGAHQFFSW